MLLIYIYLHILLVDLHFCIRMTAPAPLDWHSKGCNVSRAAAASDMEYTAIKRKCKQCNTYMYIYICLYLYLYLFISVFIVDIHPPL